MINYISGSVSKMDYVWCVWSVTPISPKPKQVNLLYLKLDLVGQAPSAFYEWYKMLVQLSII